MNAVLLSSAVALLTGPLWIPSSSSSRPTASRPTTDELRRERLPADVDLVMHLDIEGLRQTELWKRLESADQDFDLDLDELREIEEDFGIDPLTDVRALTLFKVASEEEPTVVLFSSTTKVDGALEKLRKERNYRGLERGGIRLHAWGDPSEDHDSMFAYVHAAGEERVVVLAQNEASALRAARVLRGEDPSHAKAGVGLELAPQKGSFLYLAASEIPHLDEITPASQVFGLAQGIHMDLGEAGGLLRGHMGVHTASAQAAFDVSNILNGLVSMARLAGQELGEALELLTGLRVATRASQVMVDFEFDVARLFEILEDLSGFRMDEREGR
jgi:hypothetical protein